ncbi:PREDICTED: melatonin receptor type 1B-B-like [Branchiostoma belcheri]|uniref:Melatonin receptor type 1B-B-like n=1 Tax=Branchiostoma belcheri TaxID=7741 RepID=A0A6P5AER6_BRABE|nr:PREDICTED: melatonin receptor type 1B-B-like [Branchiostoma belcheri]
MTTEASDLPTAWPTVQTFAMDIANDSTPTAYDSTPTSYDSTPTAYDNFTTPAASLSPATYICVAELFATGFALISCIGTIGNLLVITSLLVNKKLRTSLNAFITSMAMGDLIFAGVHEPLSAQALARGGLTYRPGLCTVLGAATVASASQSLIASTLIAVNRFILIEYPYTVYKKVFTPCNTFFMIAGSWTLSILVVLPPLLGFGQLGYNRASAICDFAVDNPSTFTYFMTIPGVLVFLSNGVTVVCYLKIYQKVKQSAANAHRGPGPNTGGGRRQVPGKVLHQTKHMFVMFVTFCVCTTPYSIFYTMDRDMKLSPCLWQTLTFLFACNSSINPVIHTCRSRDYRNAFRHIVCCGRRRRPAHVAKARRITVEEQRNVPAAKNTRAPAGARPGPGGSPPSDSTDTSPLQQQRGSIAVTHRSGQPVSRHSTGYRTGFHGGRVELFEELPGVSV